MPSADAVSLRLRSSDADTKAATVTPPMIALCTAMPKLMNA